MRDEVFLPITSRNRTNRVYTSVPFMGLSMLMAPTFEFAYIYAAGVTSYRGQVAQGALPCILTNTETYS